jgi:Uma2 family endonuclease
MSPAPSRKHQEVSALLTAKFVNALEATKCKVFAAPFDVRLPNEDDTRPEKIYTVVQPDLCVVCDKNKLDERGCLGAPDLVVEILSPATSSKDLHEKYNLYEQNAIKEYWIIHPNEQTLLIYRLDKNGQYQPSKLFGVHDEIASKALEGVQVLLSDIFKD